MTTLTLAMAVAAALSTSQPAVAQDSGAQRARAGGERAHAQLAPFASDRIAVEVRGPARPSGPDVILVHGLASSRAVWRRTADALDDMRRVHLVQVKGYGGKPAGANVSGAVLEPLAEELHRYIARRGLKRPVVIGHSMGGTAGLMLAARHPESVGRLMVVDALPFFSVLINPHATVQTARPMAAMMRDGMARMTAEQFAASQRASMARMVKTPAAREAAIAASLASDRGAVARGMYDVMTTDLRPELPRITAPVTVLYAHDALLGAPPAAIDRLFATGYAGLKGVRLVRVDGSLHFIMDDQPERFAREAAAFLAAP